MKRFLGVIGLVLIFSGLVGADGGVGFSYKKTPIKFNNSVVYADFVTLNIFADDWLKSRNNAGYIFGLNVSYTSKKDKFEIFMSDFYIGKRLFVFPKLVHWYFKVGPSVSVMFFNPHTKSNNYDIKVSGMASTGVQILILKGVKLFSEFEFRKYSEFATLRKGFNPNVQIVNFIPSKSDFETPVSRKSIVKQLKFGMKFSF